MAAETESTNRRRAVFLDRDGTVNEEVGYLASVDRLRLFPYSAEAVRKLNDAGLCTVLATNQGGVARGFLNDAQLAEIHAALAERLAAAGARLDAIYYCPHHPKADGPLGRACACRKPKRGMFEAAARDLGLDVARSFAVGDRYDDLAPCLELGGRGILVQTGHGRAEYERESAQWPRQPDFIAEDLLEASRWIVSALGAVA